jgi:hypothetical protein
LIFHWIIRNTEVCFSISKIALGESSTRLFPISFAFFTIFSAIALVFVAANPALGLASEDAALQNPQTPMETDSRQKSKGKQ